MAMARKSSSLQGFSPAMQRLVRFIPLLTPAPPLQPQFILEGIPAILWGVVVLFFLPDFPDTAKFLSAEEREFAIARLGTLTGSCPQFTRRRLHGCTTTVCLLDPCPLSPGDGAPKMTDKHFDKTDAWNCIKEWQFWVFAIHYFCM